MRLSRRTTTRATLARSSASSVNGTVRVSQGARASCRRPPRAPARTRRARRAAVGASGSRIRCAERAGRRRRSARDHTTIFTRSKRRLKNTKSAPEIGSAPSTARHRPSKPLRRSTGRSPRTRESCCRTSASRSLRGADRAGELILVDDSAESHDVPGPKLQRDLAVARGRRDHRDGREHGHRTLTRHLLPLTLASNRDEPLESGADFATRHAARAPSSTLSGRPSVARKQVSSRSRGVSPAPEW